MRVGKNLFKPKVSPAQLEVKVSPLRWLVFWRPSSPIRFRQYRARLKSRYINCTEDTLGYGERCKRGCRATRRERGRWLAVLPSFLPSHRPIPPTHRRAACILHCSTYCTSRTGELTKTTSPPPKGSALDANVCPPYSIHKIGIAVA